MNSGESSRSLAFSKNEVHVVFTVNGGEGRSLRPRSWMASGSTSLRTWCNGRVQRISKWCWLKEEPRSGVKSSCGNVRTPFSMENASALWAPDGKERFILGSYFPTVAVMCFPRKEILLLQVYAVHYPEQVLKCSFNCHHRSRKRLRKVL